jgi:hypothetical protein
MKLSTFVPNSVMKWAAGSPLERANSAKHVSPKLALAVLTGNYGRAEKFAVVKRVRAEMEYPAALYAPTENILPLSGMINLPHFFRLLAAQPTAVVNEAQQLWDLSLSSGRGWGGGRGMDKSSADAPSFMSALERHLTAVSRGYRQSYEGTVPVTPQAKQMVLGFEVELANDSGGTTHHFYYYISGCQIGEKSFGYQFRPERSLTGRVATAIFERTF